MRYLGIVILIHAALLPFLQRPVFPMDLTLQWDANTQVDGYKIYYKKRTSGPPYDGTGAAEGYSPIDVGWVSEFTIRALDDNEDYYLSITAYKDDLESGYSDEVTTARSVSVSSGMADGGENWGGCFISAIFGSPGFTSK